MVSNFVVTDPFIVPTPWGGRKASPKASQSHEKMANLISTQLIYIIHEKNYEHIKITSEASTPWWGRSVVQRTTAVLTTTTRWCWMCQ